MLTYWVTSNIRKIKLILIILFIVAFLIGVVDIMIIHSHDPLMCFAGIFVLGLGIYSILYLIYKYFNPDKENEEENQKV